MTEEASFLDLIRRVRTGDEHAATELVRLYEPAIRRVVRFRLAPSLRRFCDSEDVCQAVLGKFFVYAANGEFELDTPEHLMNLLAAMARNEVLKEARRQRAARRDHRRDVAAALDADEVAADGETPSQVVAARELLHEVRRRLTREERRLAELRSAGHDWAAVAAQVGGSPEALRKQLTRAVARALRQLGLDEDAEE
jgi:RNA polymerase sigma factor (sigma-70 family)